MSSEYVDSLAGHGKRACPGGRSYVIHVYELPVGPGDPAFETLALVGPFGSIDAAGRALEAEGWIPYEGEPTEWRTSAWRGPSASILGVLGQLPSG
jgi:hypothetical protein